MGAVIEDYDTVQFAVLNWALCGVSFFFTALRITVRLRNLSRLYLEDYFALSATLFMLMMAICNELERKPMYALSRFVHETTAGLPLSTPAADVAVGTTYQLKVQFAFMIFFWSTIWSVKASLLVFYRRLFIGVEGYMRLWWGVLAITILTYIGSVMSDFMCCMPITRRWSQDPAEMCSEDNARNAIYVATSFDIVTDVLVMVLPVKLLLGVRIPIRQKIGLVAVFCLGIVIIIFAIIRMERLATSVATHNTNGNISLALWSILEGFIAIVVGNLPTLKSLISRKGDSAYESGPQTHTRSTPKPRSKISPDTHIRLYDMAMDHTTDVRAAYGSSEALHTKNKVGITKTQEIKVTRAPNDRNITSRFDSVEEDSLKSLDDCQEAEGKP